MKAPTMAEQIEYMRVWCASLPNGKSARISEAVLNSLVRLDAIDKESKK